VWRFLKDSERAFGAEFKNLLTVNPSAIL